MKDRCAVCGGLVEPVEHVFLEGYPEESTKYFSKKPIRVWTYWASLYHNPVTGEQFCGPACATRGMQTRRGKNE